MGIFDRVGSGCDAVVFDVRAGVSNVRSDWWSPSRSANGAHAGNGRQPVGVVAVERVRTERRGGVVWERTNYAERQGRCVSFELDGQGGVYVVYKGAEEGCCWKEKGLEVNETNN